MSENNVTPTPTPLNVREGVRQQRTRRARFNETRYAESLRSVRTASVLVHTAGPESER